MADRPQHLDVDGGSRALLTDLYQLTMLVAYRARERELGHPVTGSFELFVRDLPPQRQFLVAAGLEQCLAHVLDMELTADDVAYLRSTGAFADVDDELLDGLVGLRFTGDVDAVPEGTIVFADEPLLRVTAPIGEAQLVETFLLATINAQTAVASRMARIRLAAGDRRVVDFGARRADGFAAALGLARASWIAGADATSNVEAGRRFGLPVTGTHAHSYVMAFADEEVAFRHYRDLYPADGVLLVDTYDTLEGVRRAAATGPGLPGVRLDSGDLGALAHAARAVLDEAGQHDAVIVASGDLDEHRIAALLADGAPIDAFGVGTRLAQVVDDPSLGAVYKLVEVDDGSGPRGVMKLSHGKGTWPGRKQLRRVRDVRGRLHHDVVDLVDATGPLYGTPLLVPYVRGGRLLDDADLDLAGARDRFEFMLASLPEDLRSLAPSDAGLGRVRVGAALQRLTDSLQATMKR